MALFVFILDTDADYIGGGAVSLANAASLPRLYSVVFVRQWLRIT